MSPSSRSIIVVVLLLILAGCSGTGGTPSDSPTGTPTPDGPATETPTPGPEAFAPGTSADGIENRSALVDAHVDALLDVDHRVEGSLLANRSGALTEPVNATVHFGANATYVDQRANASKHGVVPHESFRQGPALLRKSQGPNGTTEYSYRYDPSSDAIFWTAESRPLFVLQTVLSLGDYEFTGRTTVDGTKLLRFESDAASGAGPHEIPQFEGTVLVTPDGVVHEADGSYVVDPEGESPYRVEFSYELQLDVGPPEAPGWTDEVPQPVPERIADGKVIALENRGESALAAGTEVRVILPDRENPMTRDVTLSERLSSGETVYVYVVRADGEPEIRIAADRPTATGEFVDLSDRTVQFSHAQNELRLEVRLPQANETVGPG